MYYYLHSSVGHVGGCGISDEIVQWMDHIQNSAEDEPAPPPEPPQGATQSQAPVPLVLEPSAPHNKYSREFNEGSGSHHRSKRATKPKEENKNTCSLFIQTDPLIWRHISEQVRGCGLASYVFY
jgi:disintegrin and metalloproteinase domain-containing protein 10